MLQRGRRLGLSEVLVVKQYDEITEWRSTRLVYEYGGPKAMKLHRHVGPNRSCYTSSQRHRIGMLRGSVIASEAPTLLSML